jgi:spore coat polysaccharide biosynthesis protein SpsF
MSANNLNVAIKAWGLVVQARSGSTRLPRKMLQPFGGHGSLLSVILQKLKAGFPEATLVLATSDQTADDELASIATQMNIAVYRGSEQDVLARFVGAANEFALSHVVRICADNPFIQEQFVDKLIEEGLANPEADYISWFFGDGLPVIRSHSGFFAEWVAVSALKRAADLTAEPFFHEHVTNYIYTHPELFKINRIEIPPSRQAFFRTVRLTIDTVADWELAEKVYVELRETHTSTNAEYIETYLEQHPSIKQSMLTNIQQNEK